MSGTLRPLQRAALQAAAVKRAWRIYCRDAFGADIAKMSNTLFAPVLVELVSEMSDREIKKALADLAQCSDITEKERQEIAAILRRIKRK